MLKKGDGPKPFSGLGTSPFKLFELISTHPLTDPTVFGATSELQYILKNMMCEFFAPNDYSRDMIYSYMLIVFTELMRVYKHEANYTANHHPTKKAELLEILQFIEMNYNRCSLPDLAAQFNYNANYLGNLLKKSTGKTFVELGVQLQAWQ